MRGLSPHGWGKGAITMPAPSSGCGHLTVLDSLQGLGEWWPPCHHHPGEHESLGHQCSAAPRHAAQNATCPSSHSVLGGTARTPLSTAARPQPRPPLHRTGLGGFCSLHSDKYDSLASGSECQQLPEQLVGLVSSETRPWEGEEGTCVGVGAEGTEDSRTWWCRGEVPGTG